MIGIPDGTRRPPARRLPVLACALLLAASPAVARETVVCSPTLVHPAPAAGDQLGCSVAGHGTTLAAGANLDDEGGREDVGSVTVFAAGGAAALEVLVPGDAQSGDQFGFAIGISGDVMAVGAPFGGAGDAGAVYVYRRQQGRWVEQTRLVAADPASGERFGQTLALDGDVLLVGAPNDGGAGSLAGAAYVFTRGADGNFSQGAQVKLEASDAAPFDSFGFAVALDGGTAVVGAPFDDDGADAAGAVYVFTREGGQWTERRKLTAPHRAANDQFGAAVALDAATLAVGARRAEGPAAGTDSGLVWIFTGGGASWTPAEPPLAPADPGAGDLFGVAVALAGGRLAVGARGDGERGSGAGAAYLFERTRQPDGAFGSWLEVRKLVGATTSAGDALGQSVALTESSVVAGAFLDANGPLAGAGSAASCAVGLRECTRGDFSISKSDGRDRVRPGQAVTYRVVVESTCPRDLAGARVTDLLAQNEKLTNARWCRVEEGESCTPTNPGDVDETIILPAGADVIYVATATVKPGASGRLANEACVELSGLGKLCDDDETTISTNGGGIDLVLAKVPTSASVLPGGTISSTMHVLNRGPDTATGVVLEDSVPLPLAIDGPLPLGCRATGKPTVTCELPSIASGATAPPIVLSYRVPACFTGPDPILNAAAVTAARERERRPGDNVATSGYTMLAAAADLAIVKVETSELPARAGSQVTYSLTASNAGPQTACGVTVIDVFPAGTRLAGVTGFCDVLPDRVTCRVAELPPGESFTVGLTLELPDAEPPCPGPLVNVAEVASATADPAPGNDRTERATPLACDRDDLAVVKLASPEPVGAAAPLEYTLVVENRGTRAVAGATVRDALPEGLGEVRWCRGVDCVPLRTPGPDGDVVDTLDLPAGGSETYRIRALAPLVCGAALENTASVALPAGLVDVDPGNDTSTVTTTVIGPPGVSAYCLDHCNVAFEGAAVVYDFLLLNCGPADQADNPGDELTDTLPAGLTLTGASATSGTAATAGNTATWNGAIPSGDAVTVTVTATVDAGTAGMTLCNQATVAFDADGNGTNESVVLSDDPDEPGDADPCCILVLDAAAIPTASELGLALMALLVAALAFRRLRAHQVG